MITHKIYDSIKETPNSWDDLITHDVLLKRPFLEALEESYPPNITPFYVGVFKTETLVGVAIVQRVELYLDDVFRKKSTNIFKKYSKKIVSQIVRGNALVVGNLMHTGQHSLFYLTNEIECEDYIKQVYNAVEDIKKQIKKKRNKIIRIIAFKDYFEDDTIHQNEAFFKKENLYKVQVQPNMMLDVNPEWTCADDYISALTKKYRQRYKSARKKGSGIVKKEFSVDDVLKNESELFQLYKNVSDNAGINSFILSKHHFSSLKKEMQDNFKVFGYYINDELVGFYTLILNNDELETYFLGYNPELQQKHQLYLNMLYDMLCFGIENNFKKVVYARTAMEIKSSVGAKAHTMHIYMKHTNNFIANTLLKGIVKYMNPIREWEPRNPFKA